MNTNFYVSLLVLLHAQCHIQSFYLFVQHCYRATRSILEKKFFRFFIVCLQSYWVSVFRVSSIAFQPLPLCYMSKNASCGQSCSTKGPLCLELIRPPTNEYLTTLVVWVHTLKQLSRDPTNDIWPHLWFEYTSWSSFQEIQLMISDHTCGLSTHPEAAFKRSN